MALVCAREFCIAPKGALLEYIENVHSLAKIVVNANRKNTDRRIGRLRRIKATKHLKACKGVLHGALSAVQVPRQSAAGTFQKYC
ncbi:MAG: hypothetical protein ACWGOX_14980 [Desulforhopalus sp.]